MKFLSLSFILLISIHAWAKEAPKLESNSLKSRASQDVASIRKKAKEVIESSRFRHELEILSARSFQDDLTKGFIDDYYGAKWNFNLSDSWQWTQNLNIWRNDESEGFEIIVGPQYLYQDQDPLNSWYNSLKVGKRWFEESGREEVSSIIYEFAGGKRFELREGIFFSPEVSVNTENEGKNWNLNLTLLKFGILF